MADLKVGQELWWVPSYRHNQPSTVTVTSVGRKWAKISNGERIDITDAKLIADGGRYNSSGRCWLTRESWEIEQARHEAWRRLRSFFDRNFSPPENVGSDKIAAAFKLIFGDEQ